MGSTSPWSGWANAEIYDAFAREHTIYRQLNEHLVRVAEIATARRVLDLACGTGMTAEACLAVLPPDGELVGADASAEMVELARSRISDPRAHFEVVPAARIGHTLQGPFDRALSNAAFWQFPTRRPVLSALAQLLAPGAIFAFNVPAERLRGEATEMHPFQAALARAIERRNDLPFPHTATTLHPKRLERQLSEAGFEPAHRERLDVQCRQRELMELMEIPAMLRPLTPDLGEAAREEILAEAQGRSDPDQRVTVPWVVFVATRRAD